MTGATEQQQLAIFQTFTISFKTKIQTLWITTANSMLINISVIIEERNK
jgi:hypothetical protein